MSTSGSPGDPGLPKSAPGGAPRLTPGKPRFRRYHPPGVVLAGLSLVALWQLEAPDPQSGGVRPEGAVIPLQGEAVAPLFEDGELEALRELDQVVSRDRGTSTIPTTHVRLSAEPVEVVDGVALVLPQDEAAARRWIASAGSRITYISPTGWWRIETPSGVDLSAFLARLEQQPVFSEVQPEGVIRAASLENGETKYRALQWNLDQIGWDAAWSEGDVEVEDLIGVTVAVIDSGVAYADYSQGTTQLKKSPDLAGSEMVPGPDYIEGDGRPHDRNGHGTHIANIIAADGGTLGVAPRATLMPIRVLDQNNVGSELSLVDAIHWAVDHGAELINLSLSFPVGYVPGSAMADAIQRAEDNNVLVLAASGNAGKTQIGYPAAYAPVLAVGATRLTIGSMSWIADYSNVGPGLDLVAPGGAGTLDVNQDGKPDGVVAQSIDPQDPSAFHYYLMAGTSQAVAHATGAAAWLRSLGGDNEEIRQALVNTATAVWGRQAYTLRDGSGQLHLPGTLEAFQSGAASQQAEREYYVNVLPLMYASGDRVGSLGLIQVVNERGLPARVLVAGHWFGSVSSNFAVITNSSGQAFVTTPSSVSASSSAAFGLQVDRVMDGNRRSAPTPTGFTYISEGMLYGLFSWHYQHGAAGSQLLFQVTPGTNGLPGWLAPSYVAKPVGPMNALVPTAMAFNSRYVQGMAALSSQSYQPLTAQFTQPLSFGWGRTSSVTAQQVDVPFLDGSVRKLLIAPLDLALFYGRLAVTGPVLNSPSSRFEADNLAFIDGLDAGALGNGLSTTLVGDGLSTTLVGDGVNTTLVGDGVNTTLVGDGVSMTLVGDAFWTSVVGDNLLMSVAAEGLTTTLVGDGVAATLVGESGWSAVAGDSASVVLAGNEAAVPQMVASSYSDTAGAVPEPVEVASIAGGEDVIVVTPETE